MSIIACTMKRIVYLSVLFICILGCQNKKEETTSPEITQKEASINANKDSLKTDSLATAIPATIDEVFDDFIYGFTSNYSFQKKRIKFPLLHKINGAEVKSYEKNKWRFDAIHMKKDYYTVLYNKPSQIEIEKSKKLSQVSIELIYPLKHKFKQYEFKRLNGKWFLASICENPLSKNKNADFFSFYERFVNDSLYQRSHIREPLGFVTYEDGDPFKRIDGFVDIDQWFVFCPEMPRDILTNIDYGQTYNDPNKRVFVMHGNSNGMQCVFTFHRKKGEWVLVSFEN